MAKKNKKKYEQQNKRSFHLNKLTFHKLDWLEWISIGLGLWFVFVADPYIPLFLALLAIPFIGLILNGINGRPSIASLIEIPRYNSEKNKYDVADFIDVPALAICIRIVRDYEYESLNSLVIPGTITLIGVLMVLFATHKPMERSFADKAWVYLSLVSSIALYSYSATYGVNCVFDSSNPTWYQSTVLDKYTVKHRRYTSYNLKIAPWGHRHDVDKLSVSLYLYSRINIGDKVAIDLHEGILGIPWYHIDKK